MDTQEAYERMRAWLTRPGASRCGDSENCYYLDMYGNRCAVGALLSHQTAIEAAPCQGNVIGLFADVSSAGDELAHVSLNFLRDAQSLHDNTSHWQHGRFDVAVLDALAKDYSLTVVIDEPAVAPVEEPVAV